MKIDAEKSCCFTGHRALPESGLAQIRERLRREIAALAERGVTTFLAGGALGFDTLAAQEVLRLKFSGLPGIKLVLVLPCLGQEAKWDSVDVAAYRTLIREANEVIYTGDVYTRSCMFVRNRYLADHSRVCLCYLSREKGGTAYTVNYARSKNLEIINLAE